MTTTQTPIVVLGHGLITNQPVTVQVMPGEPGSGVVFWANGAQIPASPQAVVSTDRGVTLASPTGQALSIVEHFLSAVAMLGLSDLEVHVTGAPEMPLLDGSALEWVEALRPLAKNLSEKTEITLKQPVLFAPKDNPQLSLWAIPAETLKITYLVDFPHPALQNRWVSWSPSQGDWLTEIAPARTFGFVSELPLLQARGLAMGVTAQNTLGLTDDGGFTSDLRMPDEALRHKVLDLIGDLMLCGVPVSRVKSHIGVQWGGHQAHLAFGQLLAQALET